VFPNGEEGEDNSDYVAVFLTSRRQEDLEVKYDFSVQKSDGAHWSRIGNTFKKFSPEQNSWGYGKAFSKAKLTEKSNELLPSGKLTIVCNLEIYYSDRHTEGKVPKLEFKASDVHSLGDNMSKALNNPEFSDVTIVCGEEPSAIAPISVAEPAVVVTAAIDTEMKPLSSGTVVGSISSSPSSSFPSLAAASTIPGPSTQPPATGATPQSPHVRRFACHKAVLAARSDVFAAMFSHKATTESKTNEVIIKDTDPDILEQLLHFVYTDKVSRDDILQSASGLLTAADKYNIPRLKTICEEAMCENIEVSNAAEVLMLGYLHEAKSLQSVAVDFVTNNLSRVSETPGWKVIAESHPRIMNEVLMSMASKFRS
jgi:hypothetical protein